jgi:hypothetical protein
MWFKTFSPMEILHNSHLSYCTNIHPGKTWPEVLASLQHTLAVRDRIAPGQPFGIGLRLSERASAQLGTADTLRAFQDWLKEHDCYVFTMNGFPYGGFHGQVVKDQVHAPDWTTTERVTYTKRLFDQLALLLPDTVTDGGVSTSPISYRFWHQTPEALAAASRQGAENMIAVAAHLAELKQRTGKSLHLDIEPEPDGILENSAEFIDFFNDYLLAQGLPILQEKLGLNSAEAEAAIREHLQLCYDVCHFAVGYEEPATVLQKLAQEDIRVGKIQISAALRAPLAEADQRATVRQSLQPYDESTYLHQTAFWKTDGTLHQYPDLGPALAVLDDPAYAELRTHFHVPIFTDSYGILQSTNEEIVKTLQLWRDRPFTRHLEVETYTWDVLPDHNRLSLEESIGRELAWVNEVLASSS